MALNHSSVRSAIASASGIPDRMADHRAVGRQENLGMDADPTRSNIFGVHDKKPPLAVILSPGDLGLYLQNWIFALLR
jgi:hypothetical protein